LLCVVLASDSPAQAPAGRTDPATDRVREAVIVRKGAELAVGAGGEGIGQAPRDLAGEVTARSGSWLRVRTEVWVRVADVDAVAGDSGVTRDLLRSDPDRQIGRVVAWRLQFIALQTADELRPELPNGQPYVLARGPLPDPGFVYLAVSRQQVEQFRDMAPLEEFIARGVIRAARSRYLPTPVVELRGVP
jgi:hypothetical protein